MDDIDRAQGINDLYLVIAMTAQRLVSGASLNPGSSLDECLDCGGAIPEARQAAIPGCTRCVDCQERLEKRRRAA